MKLPGKKGASFPVERKLPTRSWQELSLNSTMYNKTTIAGPV